MNKDNAAFTYLFCLSDVVLAGPGKKRGGEKGKKRGGGGGVRIAGLHSHGGK